jgi:hypothetical protein
VLTVEECRLEVVARRPVAVAAILNLPESSDAERLIVNSGAPGFSSSSRATALVAGRAPMR